MKLTIAIVQSTINGRWGYCPLPAMRMLRPELDPHAPYATQWDAMNAVRRDRTIPREHDIKVVPSQLTNGEPA